MDWTTVISADTFSPIVTQITAVLPFIIGFSVTLLGIRKVWRFIKGQIARA